TPLVGECPARENIQNERRTVDDLDFESLLNVPELCRRELVVKHDNVSVQVHSQICNLLQLSCADVRPRIWMVQVLGCRSNNVEACCLAEQRKLFKRGFRCPVMIVVTDANQQGALLGGLGGEWGLFYDVRLLI